MRTALSILAIEMLLLKPASATELGVFHKEHFPDNTVVSLSLVENQAAASVEYDFDVFIGVSQTSDDGGRTYTDPSKHRASVRCASPAAISVRGVEYRIPTSGAEGSTWKDDLWNAVCTPPIS
ncbi:hypothetical protein [Ensifer sp. Root127]|uniref:hypothetical protein n=1 Tax=Ensifer sp. Root127 TaxID=1736440 RepID=UPI00070C25C0|nr:hypothetical protein [Ensifer sp. Root127]KQW72757.1 hypothetical protein ASD03_30825 [Ensifer sp. Root127]